MTSKVNLQKINQNAELCSSMELQAGNSEYEGRRFLTHDNGGRPFCVRLHNDARKVVVSKLPEKDEIREDSLPEDYTVPVCVLEDVERVFVGTDACEANAYLPPNFCLGNTVLIHQSNRGKLEKVKAATPLYNDLSELVASYIHSEQLYTYVGEHVLQFTAPHRITTLHAHIGNNDVPYPLALSDELVFFLGGESVCLPRTCFHPTIEWHDGYDALYGFDEDPFYERYAPEGAQKRLAGLAEPLMDCVILHERL